MGSAENTIVVVVGGYCGVEDPIGCRYSFIESIEFALMEQLLQILSLEQSNSSPAPDDYL